MKKILLSLAILTSGIFAGDYEKGMMAFDNKDYKKAIKLFKNPAKNGMAAAQFNIGVIYQYRLENKNYKKAAYYYKKCANIEKFCQANLGHIYLKGGRGLKKNYKKALYYSKKAHKQGSATADNNLGYIYANGEGVKKNYKKAYFYWSAAAEQGNTAAEEALTELCSVAPWACR